MAVAEAGSGKVSIDTSSKTLSSTDYSHPGGHNDGLFISVHGRGNSANVYTPVVKWNGIQLTQIAANVLSGGNNPIIWVGYLRGAATGNKSLDIDMGSNSLGIEARILSVTGVKQGSLPYGAASIGFDDGSTPASFITATVTTTENNSMLFAAGHNNSAKDITSWSAGYTVHSALRFGNFPTNSATFSAAGACNQLGVAVGTTIDATLSFSGTAGERAVVLVEILANVDAVAAGPLVGKYDFLVANSAAASYALSGYNHPGGTNTALLANISIRGNGTHTVTPVIKWGGVTMTIVCQEATVNSNGAYNVMAILSNASAGDLGLSVALGQTPLGIGVWFFSLIQCPATGTIYNTSTAHAQQFTTGSTTISDSVVTTKDNSLVIMVASTGTDSDLIGWGGGWTSYGGFPYTDTPSSTYPSALAAAASISEPTTGTTALGTATFNGTEIRRGSTIIEILGSAATTPPPGDDSGLVMFGTLNASQLDSGGDLFIRRDEVGDSGGKRAVYAVVANFSDGSLRIETEQDDAVSGAVHDISVVRNAAKSLDVYMDGAAVVPTFKSATARAGNLKLLGSNLYVGLGPKDSTLGGFRGQLDELRLRNSQLTPKWLLAEYRQRIEPAHLFGLGDEDQFTDTSLSPVAVPLFYEVQNGTIVTLPLIVDAILPSSGSPTLSVGNPSNGTAAAQSGTPYPTASVFINAGFTGSDAFDYTITLGSKTTTGRVYLTVVQGSTGGTPTPGAGLDFAYDQKWYGDEIFGYTQGNTKVREGVRGGYRFEADYTGVLVKTGVELRRQFAREGNTKAKGQYGDGYGGKYTITIHKCLPDGNPDFTAGGTICQTRVNDGRSAELMEPTDLYDDIFVANLDDYPERGDVWSFSVKSGQLNQGTLYWYIWTNTDTRNRTYRGYTSVGSYCSPLNQRSSGSKDRPANLGPRVGTKMQIMQETGRGTGKFSTTPIKYYGWMCDDLFWADGTITGWGSGTQTGYQVPDIGGQNQTRNTFTPQQDYDVNSYWAPLWRPKAITGTITARLRLSGSGTDIATGTVQVADIAIHTYGGGDVLSDNVNWHQFAFGKTVRLSKNVKYDIILSAPSLSSTKAQAVMSTAHIGGRDETGTKSRNCLWFKDTCTGSFSNNGGSAWKSIPYHDQTNGDVRAHYPGLFKRV